MHEVGHSSSERSKFEKKRALFASSPAYTLRSRVSFGTAQPDLTSKDARPEITSKDVIGALRNTVKRSPAFSIVSRSYVDETRDCTRSPGPQRYNQPQILANLHHPLYRMPPVKGFAGSERQGHSPTKTPGPGQYDLKLNCYLRKSPAYGFRSRESESIASALSPDCASYDVTDIVRSGKVWHGPSWTACGRPESGVRIREPGDAMIEVDLPDNVDKCIFRRKFDTGGNKRMRPVPNWSFAKSKRFR